MLQPKNIGHGLFIAFLMAASPSVAATEDSASAPAESEVQEEREAVPVHLRRKHGFDLRGNNFSRAAHIAAVASVVGIAPSHDLCVVEVEV